MYVVFTGDCMVDEYYTIIDSWPEVGGKANIKFDKIEPGGMTTNACCIFSQFGNTAYLHTNLSKHDVYTQTILNDLKKYNVITEKINFIDSKINPSTLIITDGKERIIYIKKHDTQLPYLNFNASDISFIKNASFVYTTLPILKSTPNALLFLEMLEEHNTPLFIDVDSQVSESDIKFIKKATIISVNEHGCYNLFNTKNINLSHLFPLYEDKQSNLEIVLYTKGREGATLYNNKNIQIDSNIISVKNIQDTTGAGDCFNATFLHCYLKEMNLTDCVNIANKAGAYATTYKGPRRCFLLEDILEFNV